MTFKFKRIKIKGLVWWILPVIPATWKVEIERFVV
jgi:hypothetical protein